MPLGPAASLPVASPASLQGRVVRRGLPVVGARVTLRDQDIHKIVDVFKRRLEVPRYSRMVSFEEIEKFVRAAVPLGITKLRLTGGEPLVRADLEALVAMIASSFPSVDLSMTR